eukprot:jgi/Botrbrau1/19332/Bobra.0073s0062.1
MTSTFCLTNKQGVFTPRRCGRRRGRVQAGIYAIGWDPEGILAAPKGGHIQRRSFEKQLAQDKALAQQVEREKEKARAELEAERAARVVPTTAAELVEYFLDTEGAEMQYESARCRPLLNAEFFSYLSSQIAQERIAIAPREDRLAELELLQEYLLNAVQEVDACTKSALAPVERMRKLLTAKDKRETLLQMAGDNEIDQPLLDLLQQNIDAARGAGQMEPAAFMEKIRDAARKFVL